MLPTSVLTRDPTLARPFTRAAAGLAAAIATTLAVAVPTAASPSQTRVAEAPTAVASNAAVPARNDGLAEPIYWVHGIRREEHPSFPCLEWGRAIARYRALRATGPQHTVAFYARDTGCNTRIGSFTSHKSPSIRELGRRLAWDIYNRYTRRNISVDAVGHSMGGLIIRAAITGVQTRTAGFPPRLYIEDVVTLSTPHTGAGWARLCLGSAQCADMRPGSAFLRWLSPNPQSTQGTDWTLIGTGDDDTVNWKSAVSFVKTTGWMYPGHKVVFLGGQKLKHSTVYKATTSHYRLRYWNFYQGTWREQDRGAAPIVVSRNANWFWRLW